MVSIPSRGFWFFEEIASPLPPRRQLIRFQSPRGDFGFLKADFYGFVEYLYELKVSIPSRGFWFFEG